MGFSVLAIHMKIDFFNEFTELKKTGSAEAIFEKLGELLDDETHPSKDVVIALLLKAIQLIHDSAPENTEAIDHLLSDLIGIAQEFDARRSA